MPLSNSQPRPAKWLERHSIRLLVALAACCLRPAPADHTPGLPGPYPGLRVPTATGLTVDVSTEAELIAAISNDTVKVARLVKNLRLEAKGWPATPIVRNTSFTIAGDSGQFPILDLVFIENKVQLEEDVAFTFYRLEVRNTRQRSGFEVDLFSASPGAYVRYQEAVHQCFSCLPPEVIMNVMMTTAHATVPQNITLATNPWCRTQPFLAKCYNNTNDLMIYTASADLPVSGLPGVSSGGGYVLEGLNLNFICDEPTSYECGNTKGWDICVRQSIDDVLSKDRTWEILAAAEQQQQQSGSGDGGDSSSTTAVAIGVAVGVGGGLLLLAGGAFLYIRHRRRRQQAGTMGKGSDTAAATIPINVMLNKTRAGGVGAADALAFAATGDSSFHPNDDASSQSSAGKAAVPLDSPTAAAAVAAAGPAALIPGVPPPPPLVIPALQRVSAMSAAVAFNQPSSGGASSARLVQLPAAGDGGATPVSKSSVVMLGGVAIELDAVLGAGSFGKVFRGSWQGQAVAVKVLHYGQELCRAVHTEVLLSQALKHVNIVNSLHFAQVLPGGRLAAINVNEPGEEAPPVTTATAGIVGTPVRPASPALLVGGGTTAVTLPVSSSKQHFDKTSTSIAAGSYSRFLNTQDMINPPSATYGASLVASRAAAAAAAAAAHRSGRADLTAGQVRKGAPVKMPAAGATAAGALGRPVRATAALGTGAGSIIGASHSSRKSLKRASSLPLEEFWKLLESAEPGADSQRQSVAASNGTTGATRTNGGSGGSRSRTGAGSSGVGVGPARDAGIGADGGGGRRADYYVMDVEEVEFSSRSAPDVLSGWGNLQAMRRALAGDSSTEERLPEEELMTAVLNQQEGGAHVVQQQSYAHGRLAGRLQQRQELGVAGSSTSYIPSLSSAPSSDVAAREVMAVMVMNGGAAVRAAGAGADGARPEAAECTGSLMAGVMAVSSPLPGASAGGGGGGGGDGGDARTPRIALPLEQLWLAAHAQPVEGASHGFLVMELCEGGSLQSWRAAQWRARDHRPDMAVLLPLALDIARGMLYIHSAGVCHGDLKLANVMLAKAPAAAASASSLKNAAASDSGNGMSRLGSPVPGQGAGLLQAPEPRHLREGCWVAKVGDFGLSRLLTTERTHVSTRPAGTISHMAPELWSKGHVSPQADVYAYGITLWELATGDKPYRGLNMARLVHRVLVSGGRPALPLWLPPAYTRLVTSCWAQSPKDRPTFAAIVQYLEMMIAALPASRQP